MLSAIFSFLGAHLLFLILHVQNSSFPKPLTAAQEKEYLKKMQEGDANARAVLIERNLRLVSHIVKKYYSRTNDNEELISIGSIGLIKAIDSFQPERGIHLATYAARCIENAILTQRELAERFSVNRKTVSKWETTLVKCRLKKGKNSTAPNNKNSPQRIDTRRGFLQFIFQFFEYFRFLGIRNRKGVYSLKHSLADDISGLLFKLGPLFFVFRQIDYRFHNILSPLLLKVYSMNCLS